LLINYIGVDQVLLKSNTNFIGDKKGLKEGQVSKGKAS
jgi:hypothetical protein